MDNDVSAGSTTSTLGQLALGLTLLAFGLGRAEVIDGVTAGATVRRGGRMSPVSSIV
ncbi:hypothetical protein AB0D57_20120 [Streptomyces sp. NPDC048275]|uniref:hypothetical protein n=1 Tax=Streptomyces sp. NPDC048275 TaxID=3155629 RepID=UPI0033F1D567